MEKTELRIARETVELLKKSGSQRFRRALKQNFTFTTLALPPSPMPPGHEVALSRDRQTLYIYPTFLDELLSTGTVTCAMGERHQVKFILDDYIEPDSDDTVHYENVVSE